jgi:hypothetical protein
MESADNGTSNGINVNLNGSFPNYKAFVCALGKNAPSYEDTVFIIYFTSFILPLSSTHALQGNNGP